MDPLFYELFENMPQLGPGSKESTLRALNSIKEELPNYVKLADIGCGNGDRTLLLAKELDCNIKAIDNYQDFLNNIDKQQNLKIKTICADMSSLPFYNGEMDLIWSEGAIYIMGFENGLNYWKRFLKPKGFLVISELCWTSDEKPEEAVEFWKTGYPDIKSVDENLVICKNSGYEVINHFKLPDSDWTENYYKPLQENIYDFSAKYSTNQKAQDIAEDSQLEIDIFKKYSNFYGYVFYILQKPE